MYGTLQKNRSAFPSTHAVPDAPDAAPLLTQVAGIEILIERTLNMISSEVTVISIHTTQLAHEISIRTVQNSVQRLQLNHLPRLDLCTN